MSELTVIIDENDVTAKVLRDIKIVDSLDQIKQLTVRLKEDTNVIEPNDSIEVRWDSDLIFAGNIKDVAYDFPHPNYIIRTCNCQDYKGLVAGVTTKITYKTTKTEKAILTDLFGYYCPSIIVGNYVITGEATSVDYKDSSLRRCVDSLAALRNRKWYVGYDKQLHYFIAGDETAPFGLSDNPDNMDTFPYGKLKYSVDNNDEEMISLVCWQSGLLSGQTIKVTNSKLGWNEKILFINEIILRVIGGEDPRLECKVQLGKIPPRLTYNIQVIQQSIVEQEAEIEETRETIGKCVSLPSTFMIPDDYIYLQRVTVPPGRSFYLIGYNITARRSEATLIIEREDTWEILLEATSDIYVSYTTRYALFSNTTGSPVTIGIYVENRTTYNVERCTAFVMFDVDYTIG